MIGRWGNFINQEAYGGPVEETFLRDKLHLPDFIVNQMYIGDAFHHPTFLYESLWSLLGILLLMLLRRQKFVRSGEIFLSYFIWYSIGRFFIEALRTDSLGFNGSSGVASLMNGLWSPMKWMGFEQGYLDPAYGNIRISQLLALLIIIVAVVLIIVRRVTGQSSSYYSDPIVSTKAAAADSVVPEHAVNTPQKASQETQPEAEKAEQADKEEPKE
ncbi:Prolipoprotein diacylglyceryl transferase [compost metagenome]